jgi:hypothetical protein
MCLGSVYSLSQGAELLDIGGAGTRVNLEARTRVSATLTMNQIQSCPLSMVVLLLVSYAEAAALPSVARLLSRSSIPQCFGLGVV